MQSQRLAKSVSQALLGSDGAFVEVRDSAEVLGKNLRALKDGSEDLKQAPYAAQGAIEPLMPLVERAEKNAGVVLAQQKTLTQVGQALRAINRQSSELLETAETVSSLKLQQEATAAELTAVGQLVMLTQRIGKSANEFLTTEGVSPEAVFLLGKDLNSFREIANGLLNGSAELRLAGTRDAADARAPAAAGHAVREDAQRCQRDPEQPAGPGGGARGAVVGGGRQRAAAQGLEDLQSQARRRRPRRRRDHADPARPGARGRWPRSACCACSCADQGQRARLAESQRVRGANARSTKPSASTTPTRRPFCG